MVRSPKCTSHLKTMLYKNHNIIIAWEREMRAEVRTWTATLNWRHRAKKAKGILSSPAKSRRISRTFFCFFTFVFGQLFRIIYVCIYVYTHIYTYVSVCVQQGTPSCLIQLYYTFFKLGRIKLKYVEKKRRNIRPGSRWNAMIMGTSPPTTTTKKTHCQYRRHVEYIQTVIWYFAHVLCAQFSLGKNKQLQICWNGQWNTAIDKYNDELCNNYYVWRLVYSIREALKAFPATCTIMYARYW